ncbi:hypothetical protein PCI56_03455 [Plesiomonas shigelloides subsp. oncorhynchi]|nr:hypothetical protein [Plesiomonas shigelloides]
MSDEREDEQDPIVALNASRPKPDKRKVVGFLVFVIMLVGLLIWFFYQSTPEKPREQEPPPTSTYNQDLAGRSRNQTGKTFHYAPSTPAPPRKTLHRPLQQHQRPPPTIRQSRRHYLLVVGKKARAK